MQHYVEYEDSRHFQAKAYEVLETVGTDKYRLQLMAHFYAQRVVPIKSCTDITEAQAERMFITSALQNV